MFSRKKRELQGTKVPSSSRKTNPEKNSSEHFQDDAVDVSCLPIPSESVLASCPGTPMSHSKLSGSTSAKRPTSLSRHASAAGFPFQASGMWAIHKSHSRGPLTYSPTEGLETTGIEVEAIPPLLRDVARFAEAVEKLKDVVLVVYRHHVSPEARTFCCFYLFIVKDTSPASEEPHSSSVIHECLGEVLRVLRQVISTHPLLNTVETLTAAGTLISKVKGLSYDVIKEAQKKDFEKAIESVAVAFSSNVSELLMGEIDSSTLLSLPPTEKSRSMDNLNSASSPEVEGRSDHRDCMRADEVDFLLQHGEGGVDFALSYAKSIAKYMRNIISYVDKRILFENEFSKGLHKLYQSCKQNITQDHMPLLSIFSLALEQDLEQSSGLQQATNNIYTHSFLQPMMQRRQEHEKKRREIKEEWQRAKRKLADAESSLRKSRQCYVSRSEEYERARASANKVEEEQSSTPKALDKKRRVEEEAQNKAEEAEAMYRTCITDAITQQQHLEDMKLNILRLIQELIRHTDQILRACTISYYQTMHVQTAALPVHFQMLCESCKLYDPGQQYAAYVTDLQLRTHLPRHYEFQPYSSSTHQSTRTRNNSLCANQMQNSSETMSSLEEAGFAEEGVVKQRRVRDHQAHKSWPSTLSDTDFAVTGTKLGSPTSSTGNVSIPCRPVSTARLSSSEDLEDGDVALNSFDESERDAMRGVEPDGVSSSGPFRNVGLSKAAKTHRLRKLRTPSKCRECDSYVYFQGAECEECFLACHKKCLESLAIQCGHKKLQGRLQLFGRDFSKIPKEDADGVPFIIKKCISEIESRALRMKGIYRVNGVKTRVEKLCQAFENGKELVELSQASPHDISNVLKLYLRQLPEPIMPFWMYNCLIGLAKESLSSTPGVLDPELLDSGAETKEEVVRLVETLREQLKSLPHQNISTLNYIMRHLWRVTELEQDNKMSASNLGIVFGPTLMRPKPRGATVSLSSLVDYPHQARIVEALIVFQHHIFIFTETPSLSSSQESDVGTHEENKKSSLECGVSVCSSGSHELDSDSDTEEPSRCGRCGESETSMEDNHTSSRVSVVLSIPVSDTVLEQISDQCST